MANPTGELDNLRKVLEWRFNEIWSIREKDDPEVAEAMAQKLLMEPQLSPLHRAGMHLLLASSPDDYLHHAREAVRLYSEILEGYEFTAPQRANAQKLLEAAQDSLKKARSDRSAISQEVSRALAEGKAMSDLHDAQIKALHDKARELGEDQELGKKKELGEDQEQQDIVAEAVLPSIQRMPETMGVSQSSGVDVGRSQPTAWTDIDDDTQPLPDTLRSRGSVKRQ